MGFDSGVGFDAPAYAGGGALVYMHACFSLFLPPFPPSSFHTPLERTYALSNKDRVIATHNW